MKNPFFESLIGKEISFDENTLKIDGKIFINPRLDWIDEQVHVFLNDNYLSEFCMYKRPEIITPNFNIDIYFCCSVNQQKYSFVHRIYGLKFIKKPKKWWQIFGNTDEHEFFKKIKPYMRLDCTWEIFNEIPNLTEEELIDIKEDFEKMQEKHKKLLDFFKNK